VLTWGIRIVLVTIVTCVMVALFARFSDGPIGPFPGGALRAGELVDDGLIDWEFVDDVDTIELQTNEPTLARHTWILYRRGAVFVPCIFPRLKSWPHDLLTNDDVVVRIDGRLYKRRARRVTDHGLIASLDQAMDEKYGVSAVTDGDDDHVWFFRLDPRSE
jgi:hypothetical protein